MKNLEVPNLFGCSIEQALEMVRENNLWNGYLTKTHAIGDGQWSLEVYSREDEFLFEFVGSNGTKGKADDLYGQLDSLLQFD